MGRGTLVYLCHLDFFFWKHHTQRWTAETNKPSAALEIFLLNFGEACFIWEGFAVTYFITLTYIYLFIYFWLCWVFVAAHGLSLIAASRGYSSLWCAGFSLWWLLLFWSMGSRHTGLSSCSMRAQ